MTGYIFILLAAFFNACMDAFENENYFESVFKNLDQRFWYKRVSWQNAKKISGYKIDAWHLSKSLMLICLAIALLFEYNQSWWVVILNFGAIWNGGFYLFYHKLFKIK